MGVHSSHDALPLLGLHQAGRHYADAVQFSTGDGRVGDAPYRSEVLGEEILLSLVLHLNLLNVLELGIQVSL